MILPLPPAQHSLPPYFELLENIIWSGEEVPDDRTGVGTRSLFGAQMRFDLELGFPLLTERRLHWKSIVHELLWFLKGDTNIGYLNRNGVTIWDEWAQANGNLGPIYGAQWRGWYAHHYAGKDFQNHRHIDQIQEVIQQIRTNPRSRRLIVSAWNVGELDKMALPPCHLLFQFHVRHQGMRRYLDCQLYQRSADMFLGVPFNIASYALLTHIIARLCNMYPGHFIHTIGNAHIYNNHRDQMRELRLRPGKPLPRVNINPNLSDIDELVFDDIELLGYEADSPIKAPVAV